ncbi:MAG: hypothetical protein ABIV51_05320 [Saprospiraceae bacterium]
MPTYTHAFSLIAETDKQIEIQQLAAASRDFISKSLLRAQKQIPNLEYCTDYLKLRAYTKKLHLFCFDAAFFATSLASINGHAKIGKAIPNYVLVNLLRYFNKARIEYQPYLKDKYKPLEEILEHRYYDVRNSLFQLIQSHLHERPQLATLNTFFIQFTCTEAQIQWMVKHSAGEEILINRLLRYSRSQMAISQWAISLLDESIWLPRKGEIIGRILDFDSSFVVPRGVIYRDLAELEQMLYQIKRHFTFEPIAGQGLFDSLTLEEASKRQMPMLVTPDGDLIDVNGDQATFAPEPQIIPNCPITTSFIFSMGKVGFHLIDNNKEIVQMLYQFKASPGFRYAYLSGNELHSEADPSEIFRRLDVKATVEYWLEQVPLFYKKLMLWGIHYSHLDHQQKLHLYQRHLDPEVFDTLLYIADKEENVPVLNWLMESQKE